MKVILAGATGLTGSSLARELANAGHAVTAMVRKPAPALPAAIVQVTCDFTRLDSLPPTAFDAVFCALGTTIAKAGSQAAFRAVDYDAAMAVGRYGKRCGARQFLLVSSVAAAAGSSNFYLRVKGELERDLSTLGYDSLHIFRPSFLLGERGGEARWFERLGISVARLLGPLLLGPLSKYRGIEASDVARAMVRTAEGTAGSRGAQVYHFQEMQQTQ